MNLKAKNVKEIIENEIKIFEEYKNDPLFETSAINLVIGELKLVLRRMEYLKEKNKDETMI